MFRMPKGLIRPLSTGKRILATLLVAGMLGPTAQLAAKDLGVFGRVWDIVEIDIRDLLIASAARADLSKVQDELEKAAERYMDSLPKRPMGVVESTETRWLDPSFVLDDDIRAPMRNAQGDWEWGVLHAKGTRFNPLSMQRPFNAMLFFDGSSEEQVAFVRDILAKYPGKTMPVEATGANPEKLAVSMGVPVFSLSETMMQRFRVTATPSLLYAGDGAHALELGMTAFASPFSTEEVERAWPSIRMSTSGGSK